MASLKEGDYLLILAVLSIAGVVLAGYLTYTHYFPPEDDFCTFTPFWDCGKVRESPHSVIAGIPVALAGLLGFVAVLSLTLLRFFKYDWPVTERFPLFIVILSGGGAALGAYLTYLEFFVIVAVCVLCLASFIIDLGILVVAFLLYRMG